MSISRATEAKWRTFQLMIVEARAFSAHAAMSMSYVCPPITPLRWALRSARQVLGRRKVYDRRFAPVRLQ